MNFVCVYKTYNQIKPSIEKVAKYSRMDLYDDIIDEVNSGADSKNGTDITTSSWAKIPRKRSRLAASNHLPFTPSKAVLSITTKKQKLQTTHVLKSDLQSPFS